MATVNISPNMMLPVPVPTQDPGPDWAQNLYACLYSQVDSHDHSSGKGVQITPAGLNINVNLSFQNNSAVGLLTSAYNVQTSTLSTASYPNSLYVVNGNLYFNNASTPIQITTPTAVNVTSSGISGGTATASFSSNVLVVNKAPNEPGTIQAGNYLMGDGTTDGNFINIQPPSSLSGGGWNLVLPALPGSQKFVTLDALGNLGTASSISAAQIASGSITGSQIAPTTIAAGNIVNNTITTNQISNSAGITNTQLAATNYAISNVLTQSFTSTTATLVTGSVLLMSTSGTQLIELGLIPTQSNSTLSGLSQTASTLNDWYYTIVCLKSTDGVSYIQMGTSQAGQFGGPTNEISVEHPGAIRFIDTAPTTGTVYYKLEAYISFSGGGYGNTFNIFECRFIAIER